MIGKMISYYKILEKLGAGGMGVVYKAEDTKLDRIVALKFLPQHINANESDKARFLQEAKAASAINHPNVCVIHDIQEFEGQEFIVMEYVDGETLGQKLKSGQLPLKDVTNYAIQIAEALQEAHSNGIIHRDIKADNIMVNSKNQIKVMDFGLAKLKGSLKLTKTSSTIGTISYMAPEQIAGSDVDARSDIFSFGVVLYEMLTGHFPFRGEYESAMMYSILNEEPESIQKYRNDLSSEYLHILNRSLEKDPEDRYQTMKDACIDLKRVKHETHKSPTGNTPDSPLDIRDHKVIPSNTNKKRKLILISLAALLFVGAFAVYFVFSRRTNTSFEPINLVIADFDNRTGEEELNGLSDLLATALSQSNRLNVVSRDRMYDIVKQLNIPNISRFDNDISKKICLHADVKVLVTSSIRKIGSLYTIDLKVNDVETNEYIFAYNVGNNEQESIPGMIDELSSAMRKGLKEKEKEIQQKNMQVSKLATANLEAHRHYFKAIELQNSISYRSAIGELEKAIKLDTSYAMAYYRSALITTIHSDQFSEHFRKLALQNALNHIGDLPDREKDIILAIQVTEKDGIQAGVEKLKILSNLYPEDKDIFYFTGEWLFKDEAYDAAEQYFLKVLEIDPSHSLANQRLEWTYEESGQYQKLFDAAKSWAKYYGASGHYPYNAIAKGSVLTKNYKEGIEILKKVRTSFPDMYLLTRNIAAVYAHEGDYGNAEKELRLMIDKNQQFNIRKYGYRRLMWFYPYLGRYRDAIALADSLSEICALEGDTLEGEWLNIDKAALLIHGWNDVEHSKSESEKSVELLKDNEYFRGQYGLLLTHYGEYKSADSLALLTRSSWEICIKSLTQMRQNCNIVETYPEDYYKKPVGNHFQIFLDFHIAECQIEVGMLDQAERSIQRLQEKYEMFWSRAVFYPKSFYLLGKLHEKKGDMEKAIQNYEKLLDLWKNADQDLPELIDSKARLAKLKGEA